MKYALASQSQYTFGVVCTDEQTNRKTDRQTDRHQGKQPASKQTAAESKAIAMQEM